MIDIQEVMHPHLSKDYNSTVIENSDEAEKAQLHGQSTNGWPGDHHHHCWPSGLDTPSDSALPRHTAPMH